ncbi:exported hypothetical protein [Candidatus Zixiibacteriota bacterium]|nr:exported hypothetical protein [candidate division Zixibacteria bacterium]
MKRIIIFLAFAVLVLALQFIANCSDPMDNINSRNLTPVNPGTDTIIYYDTVIVIDSTNHTDTLIIVDTINHIDTLIITDTTNQTDTLIIVDTTFHVDTVFVHDTTGHVDTVIIVEPGPDGPLTLCSRLACNQKEIIWMFRNDAGSYRLEFTAAIESDQPPQKLVVDIDGQKVTWDLSKKLELDLDQALGANAIIDISSTNPHALGHSINICLTMTKL